MGAIASQIISLTIVYSIVYSDVDQRKHKSSTSLAFVQGIHRVRVNSPHKWPVMRKMFPFDDVIMNHNDINFNLLVHEISDTSRSERVIRYVYDMSTFSKISYRVIVDMGSANEKRRYYNAYSH